MQISKYTRMEDLKTKREKLKQRLAEANMELRRAQRKVDRAEGSLRDIEIEIDVETIRSWGNTPDIEALLDVSRSSVFYEALRAFAQQWGLDVWGQRLDTHQLGLSFALDRAEIGGIERVANAVKFFAPALKSGANGCACFNIVTHKENCAHELRYRKRDGKSSVVRMFYGTDDEKKDFPSLEAALGYIEEHLWCENIIDSAEGLSLEAPQAE